MRQYEDGTMLSAATNVEHPLCPPQANFVRGYNYPCGCFCIPLPGEPDRTQLLSFFQTDLGGYLPQTVVDSFFPASIAGFYSNLTKAVKALKAWWDQMLTSPAEGRKWTGSLRVAIMGSRKLACNTFLLVKILSKCEIVQSNAYFSNRISFISVIGRMSHQRQEESCRQHCWLTVGDEYTRLVLHQSLWL